MPSPTFLTSRFLSRWPLRFPSEGGDKEERGRVLVAGGCAEMPGAIILAAEAAMRAGAGKLDIATVRSVAPLVAVAVPEARVRAMDETEGGCLAPSGAASLCEWAGASQAFVLGPGMMDGTARDTFIGGVLQGLDGSATLILDAAALATVGNNPAALRALNGNVILTPHAGEMAGMLSADKDKIRKNPMEIARLAAAKFKAVVALKGRETFIAAPDGQVFVNEAGNVGLATSGSGDTLAGIIGGLAARGAEPLQAAVWGVALHARAGDILARRLGPLGYLARELPPELPALMESLRTPQGPRRNRRP